MEMGPLLKVRKGAKRAKDSLDLLVKPEIKPETPGLQDEELIHYTQRESVF